MSSIPLTERLTPSPADVAHLAVIRDNVDRFIANAVSTCGLREGLVLDIAPQVHRGARGFFPSSFAVETLDIDPGSGATYIADITKCNRTLIPDGRFDVVICAEVLEHTLQPFSAVDEIYRLLRPGGIAYISTPFNFRIHGPLPDCWRFTEHGLRALFANYDDVLVSGVETEGRPLMPIHYTVVARKRLSPD